jgi:predicted metalloprotease
MGIMGILIIIGIMIFFPEFGKLILGGGLPGGGSGGFPKIELPQTPRQTTSPSTGRTGRQSNLPRGGVEDSAGQGKATTDAMRRFLSVVLADTEDVWNNIFSRMGRSYKEPKMVMFSGYTRTACGVGMRQMGPFYCPLDQRVYIDTAFYDELQSKFGASGDFAQAYVIAHEVGHHVQTLLGITEKVQKYKSKYGPKSKASNAVQVRMELQADCFAGVWAKRADRAKNILERGDLEEALNAANAIGDDKIQKRTTGYVVPDSFTHGSSAQRMRWFRRGFDQGNVASCDTFSVDTL